MRRMIELETLSGKAWGAAVWSSLASAAAIVMALAAFVISLSGCANAMHATVLRAERVAEKSADAWADDARERLEICVLGIPKQCAPDDCPAWKRQQCVDDVEHEARQVGMILEAFGAATEAYWIAVGAQASLPELRAKLVEIGALVRDLPRDAFGGLVEMLK